MMLVHPAYRSRSYGIWHWCLRGCALATLIALAPLFVVLFVLVKFSSSGPFLFRQQRPGYQGRLFSILKIRTMKKGSERNLANGLGVTRGHPSVTWIGKILRDLKLDELPQLWNIVRGDMEFVGPRPIAPVLHDKLRERIANFDQRLSVRPGLTNLGQVVVMDNGVDEHLVADWTLRLEGEMHYIERKSVLYDMVLITMTAMFVGNKLCRRLLRAGAQRLPIGRGPGSEQAAATP